MMVDYAVMVESKIIMYTPYNHGGVSRFWLWQQESVLGSWQECVISICAKMSSYGGELRGVLAPHFRGMREEI